MKPESQRVAIAEAHDGVPPGTYTGRNPRTFRDYLNDLNAMNEAEEILDTKQRKEYVRLLNQGYGAAGLDLTDMFLLLHATAAQRAEAFLKTLNLWDDSK